MTPYRQVSSKIASFLGIPSSIYNIFAIDVKNVFYVFLTFFIFPTFLK